MSLPLSQGFLASTNAYTRIYDELIKPIPGEAEIVNNTLLYDTNIANAFFFMGLFNLTCQKWYCYK